MILFDHIAIGCSNLAQGIEYVSGQLGAVVPPGGKHPLMGTHNCVMSTGPDTFFEIISVDPEASAPPHSRWFGLDDPKVETGLKNAARPLAWVVNSDDLDHDLDIARAAGVDFGTPLTLTRGDLKWRFAVRDDGAIPLDGVAPMIMEWPQMPTHPAAQMPDMGVRIRAIKVITPKADVLNELLSAIGGDIAPVEIIESDTPGISVMLSLKNGRVAVLN